jgi:hypothetical protein
MVRAWRCVHCRCALGEIARDDAGRATLIIWIDVGASVRPIGRDFEITCPCGGSRTFVGGWLRFAQRTRAA